MPRVRLPYFPLVLTVLFWAFNFPALKLLYEEIPAPAVALLALNGIPLLVMSLVGVVLRATGRPGWASTNRWSRARAASGCVRACTDARERHCA